MISTPHGRLLGQQSAYPTSYSPNILEGIPRLRGREPLLGHGIWHHHGIDVWTIYEAAFLRPDGRPQVGIAELHIGCHSPYIVESKSLKLYLFSLNRETFDSHEAYAARVCQDLQRVVGSAVTWHWLDHQSQHAPEATFGAPTGTCIDEAPFVKRTMAQFTDSSLGPSPEDSAHKPMAEQRLYSNLLRSLCPVTAQPDWATLVVQAKGPAIEHDWLLSYVAAFYDHQGFHEQCVEQIFLNILARYKCAALTVYARYTRRGGIDINPLRSTLQAHTWPTMRRTQRQ